MAELFSVMRTFTELTQVEIVRAGGRRELYDNLVFANGARIAKYGRLSNTGHPDDGLFGWCLGAGRCPGSVKPSHGECLRHAVAS